MPEKDGGSAYPVDYDKVALTKGDPLTQFAVSGYVRGHRDYYFSSKVYDRASTVAETPRRFW